MAVTENEADNTGGAVVNYSNRYTPKKNVAAVFCGVGKTPEEAIVNLYSRAAEKWAGLAIQHSDISYNPSLTEFDEIIPVDLSSGHPWYNLKVNNTSGSISLDDGAWIRGNEFAYYRSVGELSKDEYEGVLENVRNMSLISLNEAPKYPEQIMFLSTCYYHTDEGRFVVAAYRIK